MKAGDRVIEAIPQELEAIGTAGREPVELDVMDGCAEPSDVLATAEHAVLLATVTASEAHQLSVDPVGQPARLTASGTRCPATNLRVPSGSNIRSTTSGASIRDQVSRRGLTTERHKHDARQP